MSRLLAFSLPANKPFVIFYVFAVTVPSNFQMSNIGFNINLPFFTKLYRFNNRFTGESKNYSTAENVCISAIKFTFDICGE